MSEDDLVQYLVEDDDDYEDEDEGEDVDDYEDIEDPCCPHCGGDWEYIGTSDMAECDLGHRWKEAS